MCSESGYGEDWNLRGGEGGEAPGVCMGLKGSLDSGSWPGLVVMHDGRLGANSHYERRLNLA